MPGRSFLAKLVRLPPEDEAAYRERARHRDRLALRIITTLILTGLTSRLFFDWNMAPDLLTKGAPYRIGGILCFLVAFAASFHRGAVAYLHPLVGVSFLTAIALVLRAYTDAPMLAAFASTTMGIALILLGIFSFGRRLVILVGTMAVVMAALLMPLTGTGTMGLAPRLMLSGTMGMVGLLASCLLEQHWRRSFLAERELERSHENLQRAHRELGEAHATLKATQAQLVKAEKTAALGRLVAGMAHRLNTPVGTLVGMASHLADTGERFSRTLAGGGLRRSDLAQFVETVNDASTIVLENARHTARLIDAFKQLEANAGETATAVDLRDLLTQRLPFLQAVMPPGITLTVEVPSGLTAWAAPNLLDSIIGHIVGNAVRHAFPDGRGGTVSVRAGPDGEGGVLLSIADDGCGISPEHLENVFDPFYTDGHIGGGEGLGLSIVHSAVTGPLGGRIAIDSREGQGTIVTVRLPAAGPASESPANRDVAAASHD